MATITIDRPEVLNAIRDNTMFEIQDALNILEKDDSVRVLVLTGAGDKAFVAGGDISIMQKDIKILQERMRQKTGEYLQEVRKNLTPEQRTMLRPYWTVWDSGYN